MHRSSILLLLVAAAACGGGGGAPPTPPALGEARQGLTPDQQQAFDRGKAVFERRFRRADGHGPDFNTSSCRSCHEIPVSGGSAPLYRNFRLVGEDNGGMFQPVLDDMQFVARLFSYERSQRESIPMSAIVAHRNSPPIFGAGLLESIPPADILANQDPFDDDGDGIRGRPNFDGLMVGRFGFKAQSARLVDFVRGPLFNHMGVTTDPLPPQLAGGLTVELEVGSGEMPTMDGDAVADPELGEAALADLVAYVRFLAPPPPGPLSAAGARGRDLFTTVGCTSCHIPNIVRNGDPVFAYTDLLIHDMGPALADGVRQGDASGNHFRTQPLWGLRHHAPYLHDGRADTIDDAIRAHGGEAAAIRDAYAALTDGERADLLAFLETR